MIEPDPIGVGAYIDDIEASVIRSRTEGRFAPEASR